MLSSLESLEAAWLVGGSTPFNAGRRRARPSACPAVGGLLNFFLDDRGQIR
jgi:hypothetical protein